MENTFTKWFRSEIAVAFAIGATVAGVMMYFVNATYPLKIDLAVMQQQLDNIKNNDLTHIELQITEIKKSQDDALQVQIGQGQQITEILTLLKLKK